MTLSVRLKLGDVTPFHCYFSVPWVCLLKVNTQVHSQVHTQVHIDLWRQWVTIKELLESLRLNLYHFNNIFFLRNIRAMLTSIPCCSLIAPLVCIQQTRFTSGTKKRIPPIKHDAVPAASVFCPNVTHGINHAIMPVLILMIMNMNANIMIWGKIL